MYEEFEDDDMKEAKKLDDQLKDEIEAAVQKINNKIQENDDNTLIELIQRYSLRD